MAKFIEIKCESESGMRDWKIVINTDYIVKISDNDHYRFIALYHGQRTESILTKESYASIMDKINS